MGIQQMIMAAGGLDEYLVDNSLRFQSGDSERLLWTPSSAGNRKTWTWSGWVKLCGNSGHLISADNDDFQFEIRSDYQYLIKNDGCFSNTWSGTTYSEDQFYHFVIEHDATNTYCKIWVNGSLSQTITATNTNGAFNNNTAHGIGCRSTSLDSFIDFYLADLHFVDGTALDASSFGETVDGSWVAKEFSGSHGTNGYHLKFENTSNKGEDSANSNDWTANNFDGTSIGAYSRSCW